MGNAAMHLSLDSIVQCRNIRRQHVLTVRIKHLRLVRLMAPSLCRHSIVTMTSNFLPDSKMLIVDALHACLTSQQDGWLTTAFAEIARIVSYWALLTFLRSMTKVK